MDKTKHKSINVKHRQDASHIITKAKPQMGSSSHIITKAKPQMGSSSLLR
jgi:hypothetical protein